MQFTFRPISKYSLRSTFYEDINIPTILVLHLPGQYAYHIQPVMSGGKQTPLAETQIIMIILRAIDLNIESPSHLQDILNCFRITFETSSTSYHTYMPGTWYVHTSTRDSNLPERIYYY